MNLTRIKTALGFALALAIPAANAQIVPPVDSMEGVNIIGLAGGVAPDYMGSSNTKGGIAPIFRYQLPGSER